MLRHLFCVQDHVKAVCSRQQLSSFVTKFDESIKGPTGTSNKLEALWRTFAPLRQATVR